MKYLRKNKKTKKTKKTKINRKLKNKTKSRKIFGGAALQYPSLQQFNFNHNGNNTNNEINNNKNIGRHQETNLIGAEIRRTSGDPSYCRGMECHKASYVLDSFISQFYDQVPFDEFNNITTNTDEIIGYIQTCLQYSRIDIAEHFMLSLQCHGHFFAIEIFNGKFRILSSYSGKHSLYEYLTQNAYGHFQQNPKKLLLFLRELNSGDQRIIIHAKRNLFGSGAKFPNDRITPLTLMTIYNLIKK